MSDETISSDGASIAPPSIPKRADSPAVTPSPPQMGKVLDDETADPDTLIDLLLPALKQTVRHLPGELPKMGIYLGVVFVANFLLMQVNLNMPPLWIPNFMIPVLYVLVFATAAHNSLLPKTLFWVTLYKFGKHLFRTARREGWDAPLTNFAGGVSLSLELLQNRVRYEPVPALIGAGLGMLGANYLAGGSAGRSSVALLVACVILYQLGVKPNMFFNIIRVGAQDVCRLLRKPRTIPEHKVQMSALFITVGTVVSLFFMLVRVPAVGYVLGGLSLLGAIVFSLAADKKAVHSGS